MNFPINLPYLYCCFQKKLIPKNHKFLIFFDGPFPDEVKYKKIGNFFDSSQCPLCLKYKIRRAQSKCYGFDLPPRLHYTVFYQ